MSCLGYCSQAVSQEASLALPAETTNVKGRAQLGRMHSVNGEMSVRAEASEKLLGAGVVPQGL